MHPSVIETFSNGSLVTGSDVRGRRVLEVGSYNVNGSIRPVVEGLAPSSYLGVDATAGPGVDQVVDCTNLVDTFGWGSFDVVITTEMLEHVVDWRRCVGNLAGVVAPGGLLVITTRSPGFPYHGYPDDHWRYTPLTLAAILESIGFDQVVVMDDPDPFSPGVFARARKPVDWELPDESVLLAAHLQPQRAPSKPLNILGYPHQGDGSTYYRFQLPFQQLAHSSRHAVMLPAPNMPAYKPADDELAGLDMIVGQRFMGPGLDLWAHWKDRVKLVYETDDDILRPDTSSGLAHLHDTTTQQSAIRCITMADLVTVSTPVLAEQMAKYNPNVRVLPNYVHADVLTIDRPRRDRVTLGWAGGMSHLADWAMVMDPIACVLDSKFSTVDMHFIGIDYGPLLRRKCRYTPWLQDVWAYYKTIDFDIGLAPVADTPFNTCKSHIKALEYMALGIPVVASDCPAYRDLVVDGVTGHLCRTDEEWIRKTESLIHDEAMRVEMGAKGREIASQWTIQQGWRGWRDAYEEVTGWQS